MILKKISKIITSCCRKDALGVEKQSEALLQQLFSVFNYFQEQVEMGCRRHKKSDDLKAVSHASGSVNLHYYNKCPHYGLFPRLHHPDMSFNMKRLETGVQILARALNLALQKVTKWEDEKYVRISDDKRINNN